MPIALTVTLVHHPSDAEDPRCNGAPKSRSSSYVACISNRGYRTSLVVRRIYRALPDADAEKHGLVRVVDETAEDYLYPAGLFVAITVPVEVEKTFKKAS